MAPDRAKKELNQLIDLRNKQSYRAEEIDKQIWERFGTRCYVMVSDLSGFTLLTRRHGIVHFLGLYHRSLELCRPEIEVCSGKLLKAEKDNMLVTFEDPRKALECAVRINKAIKNYGQKQQEDWRLGICIGLSYGEILRTEADAFGDAVNVAYKLGEDTAKAGEILVCDQFLAQLVTVCPSRFQFESRQETTAGQVVIGYHHLMY